MTQARYIVLALLQGAAVALQGATNAGLRTHVGLGAAMVVNTTPILLVALALATADGSLSGVAAIRTVPPQFLIGGLYGFTIIIAAILAFPKLGAARTLLLVVTSQLVVALILDHLGALGLPRTAITWQRGMGVALAVAGVILARG